MLGAEGFKLTDKLAMSPISGHEMYHHSNVKIFCDTCQMLNHSDTTCWEKESNARRSRTHFGYRGKTNEKKDNNKGKKLVKQATLSSSADEYDDSGE